MGSSLLTVIVIIIILSSILAIAGYCNCSIKFFDLLGEEDKLDDSSIMYLNIDLYNSYLKKINDLIKYYKRANALHYFLNTAATVYFVSALVLARKVSASSMYPFLFYSALFISILFGLSISVRKAVTRNADSVKKSINDLLEKIEDTKYVYQLSDSEKLKYDELFEEQRVLIKSQIFGFSKISFLVKMGFGLTLIFIILLMAYMVSNSSV